MKKLLITALALTLAIGLTLTLAACSPLTPTADTPAPKPATTPEPTPAPEPTPEPTPEHIHDWRDANYQEPKTCIETGETDGDPLPPAFPTIGRDFNKIGVAYDYKSVNSEGDEFVGSVTVSDVRVTPGDDYFLPKEGYEWLIFRYDTQTRDERTYPGTGYVSYYYRFYGADYYSHDLGSKPYPISGEELAEVGTVNYYGIDYPIYNQDQVLVDEGGETWSSSEWEVGFLVPVGYDGIYVFFYNANNVDRLNWTSWDDPRQHDFLIGDAMDDDSLLFRLREGGANVQPSSSASNIVDADLEGIWINGSGDDIHLFEDIESIGFTIEPDRDGGGGEVLVDLEGNNKWEWWADWWLSPYGELCTDDYEWALYNEFTCTIVGNTLTLIDKDGNTRTYTRG